VRALAIDQRGSGPTRGHPLTLVLPERSASGQAAAAMRLALIVLKSDGGSLWGLIIAVGGTQRRLVCLKRARDPAISTVGTSPERLVRRAAIPLEGELHVLAGDQVARCEIVTPLRSTNS